MHETFDNPPIIIRQSLGKLILTFGLWLSVAVALIPTLAGPHHDLTILGVEFSKAAIGDLLYAALFVFASLAAVAAFSIVNPERLILEPSGVTWKRLWGTRHLIWDDVERFHVGHASSRKVVFYNLSQRYLWEHPRRGAPLCQLGTSWEKNARELADLLNSAKAKWGEDRTPGYPDLPLPSEAPPMPRELLAASRQDIAAE
jgi:hypothetical protein